MKKSTRILLAASICLLCSSQSFAQTPFSTTEYLDINKFNAAHMVHGDMWYDPGIGEPGCEYPKSTGKHANYLGAIWMGGFDGSGTLRGATTIFRTVGVEYYPGPLDTSGKCTYATSSEWAKIWKVNANTIADFRAAYSSGGSAAITASKYNIIKEWPAVGNIYAIGATGGSLSALLGSVDTNGYAPFVDVNVDGVYNWKDGDYPKIKGDQMLWWVINDNTSTHTLSKSPAMGIEVQVSAYAYNRGSSVDRMLFYEYKIINKSNSGLDSFVFSILSAADLGNPFDDALAIDSNRRMVVEFNPEKDGPNGANSYGNNPPLAALSIVEMPGDIFPSAMQKVGSFGYFKGTGVGPYRIPNDMGSFYRYMTGSNADGFPIDYGAGASREFYNLNAVWNPCDSPSLSADRKYIISTKPFSFPPKATKKVAMVFMATDTNAHICHDLKLKEIKDLADTSWDVYWYPLPSLGIKHKTSIEQNFKLYPNPAETILYLSTNTSVGKTENIRIVDGLGRTINLPIVQKNNQYEININSLASGIYSVVFDDGNTVSTQRFVKK